MKRVLKIVLILLITLIINVEAANYELKELIPSGIKTTVVTDHFSYRNFYQENDKLVFDSIKNIADTDLPITITVALFDSNKKNIGTINYCDESDILLSKAEKPFTINLNDYLVQGKSSKDIKYIAVLSENYNCNLGSKDVYKGQTISEIGTIKKNYFTGNVLFLLKIVTGIVIVLIILFVYKLLFTTSYENFDGNEVRKDYDRLNKKLAEDREEERRKNPPKPKEKVKTKTDEVIKQEEEAKKKGKEDSDLHNFYK